MGLRPCFISWTPLFRGPKRERERKSESEKRRRKLTVSHLSPHRHQGPKTASLWFFQKIKHIHLSERVPGSQCSSFSQTAEMKDWGLSHWLSMGQLFESSPLMIWRSFRTYSGTTNSELSFSCGYDLKKGDLLKTSWCFESPSNPWLSTVVRT